jgi:hypothetical protein
MQLGDIMPARKPPDPNAKPQIERFRDMARELGCDEDPAAFDAILTKIARAPTLPKYKPKMRAPKK